MEYTIYHIPGVKIGCTAWPEKRIPGQGFTEYEILEVHTDIYEASNREIELQKQYGYTPDQSLYWQTVQNSGLNLEARIKGGHAVGFTFEQRSKGGKALKGRPKPYHIGLNLQKQKTCPHCNKITNAGNYTRWHGDNCKQK
jgi:hypothetical protein